MTHLEIKRLNNKSYKGYIYNFIISIQYSSVFKEWNIYIEHKDSCQYLLQTTSKTLREAKKIVNHYFIKNPIPYYLESISYKYDVINYLRKDNLYNVYICKTSKLTGGYVGEKCMYLGIPKPALNISLDQVEKFKYTV